MKAPFLFILLLAIFTTCSKKESLPLCEDETTYSQVNAPPSTDPIVQYGYRITLLDDDRVDILPGGDIVYRGTYSIKGNILEITVAQLDTKFKFTIISDNELHGEHGQIMKRQDCH